VDEAPTAARAGAPGPARVSGSAGTAGGAIDATIVLEPVDPDAGPPASAEPTAPSRRSRRTAAPTEPLDRLDPEG
jgi:hypothetical protein